MPMLGTRPRPIAPPKRGGTFGRWSRYGSATIHPEQDLSMWAFFERLLDTTMFSPHGICLLWEPELIWLHVASDALIAAAYFSIPAALSIFVSRRPDVDFGWVFWAFALFIMACGVGHVMSIITLWYPVYGIEGIVKAMT